LGRLLSGLGRTLVRRPCGDSSIVAGRLVGNARVLGGLLASRRLGGVDLLGLRRLALGGPPVGVALGARGRLLTALLLAVGPLLLCRRLLLGRLLRAARRVLRGRVCGHRGTAQAHDEQRRAQHGKAAGPTGRRAWCPRMPHGVPHESLPRSRRLVAPLVHISVNPARDRYTHQKTTTTTKSTPMKGRFIFARKGANCVSMAR